MSAMPQPLFEVLQIEDTRSTTLALRGELDMYSAPLLARELEKATEPAPSRLVLDLAALSFMDVSGLRTILDSARRVRRYGGSLEIANPMPHIVRLLELTAIDQSLVVRGRPLSAVA